MSTPKISVIVPVYKVEQYLHRCVDSILAQTFTDFELLLINDGSPDNCGAICDEYAAKDARVRVFHKENGGVSSARNLGLDNAKGEWVAFVDSDDWVETQFLECFLEDRNFDMVIQSYKIHSKKAETVFLTHGCYINNEISTLMSHLEESRFSPIRHLWNKCFRNKIISQSRLRFNESIHLGEDYLFIIEYLYFCEKVVCISECNYNYVIYQSGLHAKPTNIDKIISWHLEILKASEHYSQKFNRTFEEGLKKSIYNQLVPIIFRTKDLDLVGKERRLFLLANDPYFRLLLSERKIKCFHFNSLKINWFIYLIVRINLRLMRFIK